MFVSVLLFCTTAHCQAVTSGKTYETEAHCWTDSVQTLKIIEPNANKEGYHLQDIVCVQMNNKS